MTEHDCSGEGGRERSIETVALFSVLVHARDVGEHQKAAEAQRKLRRLGVVVAFREPASRLEGGMS